MSKMTPAQKVNAAIERAEAAAIDLIRAAECLARTDQLTYAIDANRRVLLQRARRYGRAIDAVTRCRK